MNVVNFENINKNLCIICDKQTNMGRVTCSYECHKEFIKFCEERYGTFKKVVDIMSRITYKVPIVDIIEKGLKWEDLTKYPILEDNDVV